MQPSSRGIKVHPKMAEALAEMTEDLLQNMKDSPGKHFVYSLNNPHDYYPVMYIGKTSRPLARYWQHVDEARNYDNENDKSKWIRSLLDFDLLPIMHIEYICLAEEADMFEAYSYQDAISIPRRLTNKRRLFFDHSKPNGGFNIGAKNAKN